MGNFCDKQNNSPDRLDSDSPLLVPITSKPLNEFTEEEMAKEGEEEEEPKGEEEIICAKEKKQARNRYLTVSGCYNYNYLRLLWNKGRLRCCICMSIVSLEKDDPNEFVFLLKENDLRCCMEAHLCRQCWQKNIMLTHPWTIRVRNSDLALMAKDPVPDEGPTCPICRTKVLEAVTFSKATILNEC